MVLAAIAPAQEQQQQLNFKQGSDKQNFDNSGGGGPFRQQTGIGFYSNFFLIHGFYSDLIHCYFSGVQPILLVVV